MSDLSLSHPPLSRRSHGALRFTRAAWGLALPSTLLLIGLMLVPVALIILMSFTDYSFGDSSFSWVGFENYLALAEDDVFWNALGNTLRYVAIVVPGAVGLGLLQAVLVQNLRHGRRLYQLLLFLPVTSTLVAMATVWKYLLHGNIGPVNFFLEAIGIGKLEFFGSPDLVLWALAIIGIWGLAGFNMVIFTAGLTSIPQDLYEAASVDGMEHPLDRFCRITLPMLAPTMVFVVITSSITAFKIFDTVAVLTRGGPQGASDVLLYTTYLEGFQYLRMAPAAAMTVVFLMIILALALLQNLLLDRRGGKA